MFENVWIIFLNVWTEEELFGGMLNITKIGYSENIGFESV